MLVFVLLEARSSAGLQFEIPQFTGTPGLVDVRFAAADDHMAFDADCGAGAVAFDGYAFPAVAACANDSLLRSIDSMSIMRSSINQHNPKVILS